MAAFSSDDNIPARVAERVRSIMERVVPVTEEVGETSRELFRVRIRFPARFLGCEVGLKNRRKNKGDVRNLRLV